MENQKPVTYITTYRGVRKHTPGLYEGNSRDVLITGGDFNRMDKYRTIPKDVAKGAFQSADHSIRDIQPRIDEMFVYLGADGAGPGFDYIKESIKGNESINTKIVACNCGSSRKKEFAKTHKIPIIWAECGGMDTLERIVRNSLK